MSGQVNARYHRPPETDTQTACGLQAIYALQAPSGGQVACWSA